MKETFWSDNTSQTVHRMSDRSVVHQGHGYHMPGRLACSLRDTGNGYIAHFPAYSCTTQDYYVCLDYAQAHDLVLALSAFKKELGFV